MTNEPPTLEDYENTADVEFDLTSQEIDRKTINTELERLFSG